MPARAGTLARICIFYYLNVMMSFKWKIFKALLFGGLILSMLSFPGWTVFYIRIHPVFAIGTNQILLFVALVFTILYTFFLFWLFKEKFPAGAITNSIEGIVYSLSLVLFVGCLFISLHGYFSLEAIINDKRPPDRWIIFLKYLSIETLMLSAVYIYIGINALQLINSISKNRLDVI